MNKKNKPQTLDWEAFKSLGNPDNAQEINIEEDHQQEDTENLNDKVRVYLERKGRSGKTVSIIKGLTADHSHLEEMCKSLKGKCGVGGKVENDHIIIQGDQRDRLIKELHIIGYTNVKNAGA